MYQNQLEKVGIGFWSLNPNKASKIFFYLLLLFLPTQLGRHFWPDSSFVFGLRLDYLSPTLYLTDVFIILIFICSFVDVFRSLKKINKTYLYVFVLFSLSLVVGIATSRNLIAGYYGLVKFLEFSFLSYYVFANLKNLNKQIIFLCFFSGLVFESLLSFLQYLNQGSVGSLFYFFGERAYTAQTPGIANASINGQMALRPYATFSHPNVLAGYLVSAMLYLLIFYTKGKFKKIFIYTGILLGTLSLFITLSRVAIILWAFYLFILFGVLMYEKYKKEIYNLKIAGTLAVIAITILIGLMSFKNTLFLQRFISTNLSDESIAQREELIKQSSGMFLQNPVFGVGVNNFYNNETYLTTSQGAFILQPVHNIFLLVLAETGAIGFTLFIFVLAKTAINTFKTKSYKKKYLLMILFSIIFLGNFDHYFFTLQQGQVLLALFIGIANSYKNI